MPSWRGQGQLYLYLDVVQLLLTVLQAETDLPRIWWSLSFWACHQHRSLPRLWLGPCNVLESYLLIYARSLVWGVPDLAAGLIVVCCDAERNFSKLSVIKQHKFRSTVLEEGLNYISVVSVENHVTKSLSYGKGVKNFAAKKCRKNVL